MASDKRSLLSKKMFTNGELSYTSSNFDIYTPRGDYWCTIALYMGMTKEAMFRWLTVRYPLSDVIAYDRVKVVRAFEDKDSPRAFWIENPFTKEEREGMWQFHLNAILSNHEHDLKSHAKPDAAAMAGLKKTNTYMKEYYARHREQYHEYYIKKRNAGLTKTKAQ